MLNPQIQKYHLKRCLDIWKSKLGDTQRMKNKIHLLFDDYIYSDKVHDGLFGKPKEDIINLLRDAYDRKKDAANKISELAKAIDLVKKQNKNVGNIENK